MFFPELKNDHIYLSQMLKKQLKNIISYDITKKEGFEVKR